MSKKNKKEVRPKKQKKNKKEVIKNENFKSC